MGLAAHPDALQQPPRGCIRRVRIGDDTVQPTMAKEVLEKLPDGLCRESSSLRVACKREADHGFHRFLGLDDEGAVAGNPLAPGLDRQLHPPAGHL